MVLHLPGASSVFASDCTHAGDSETGDKRLSVAVVVEFGSPGCARGNPPQDRCADALRAHSMRPDSGECPGERGGMVNQRGEGRTVLDHADEWEVLTESIEIVTGSLRIIDPIDLGNPKAGVTVDTGFLEGELHGGRVLARRDRDSGQVVELHVTFLGDGDKELAPSET